MPDLEKLYQQALNTYQEGNLPSAEIMYRQLAEYCINKTANVLNDLAVTLHQQGNMQEAIPYLQQAVNLVPSVGIFHYNLANLYRDVGLMDQTIIEYLRALEYLPQSAVIHNNLGLAYYFSQIHDKALAYFDRAIELEPHFAEAYNNKGVTLQFGQRRYYEARECFLEAVRLKPDYCDALNNLAAAYSALGQSDEAMTCYYTLVSHPDCPASIYSNLLLNLHYHSQYSVQQIFAEHQRWGRRYSAHIPVFQHIPPSNIPQRRLRIGYLSPDFREHSVAYFIEGALAEHDKTSFEISCYSMFAGADEITQRLQQYVDGWHDIYGLPDEQVVNLIRQDNIDILVDLAGHTAHNQLLVLAHKPAPIQATMLGYPNTTGLTTVDYWIADHYTNPQGSNEQPSTEKVFCLPGSYFCYRPNSNSPQVNQLPALQNGFVSFGLFANPAKLVPEMITIYADIMKQVKSSQLLLKANSYSNEHTRNQLIGLFAACGINSNRISFLPYQRTPTNHLFLYNKVDLALETYPYNGATTTCEALWMGVPVPTLAGQTHASRMGVSILTAAGLDHWITYTPQQYLNTVVHLTRDLPRLNTIRQGLRDRIAHSALTDASGFTNRLEAAYQQMWQSFIMQHHH